MTRDRDSGEAQLTELVDLAQQDAISARYFAYKELDDGKLRDGLEKVAGLVGEIDAGKFQGDLSRVLRMDPPPKKRDKDST